MSGHVVHAAHRFNRRESIVLRRGEVLLAVLSSTMFDLADHYMEPGDISAAFNLSIEYEETRRLVAELEEIRKRVELIHATHEKGQQS